MYEAKISAYVVLLGSYKLVARLPSSYMPFSYKYPTNIILQYPDRTAFALAALMLSSLGTATYTYLFMGHTMHVVISFRESTVCVCLTAVNMYSQWISYYVHTYLVVLYSQKGCVYTYHLREA